MLHRIKQVHVSGWVRYWGWDSHTVRVSSTNVNLGKDLFYTWNAKISNILVLTFIFLFNELPGFLFSATVSSCGLYQMVCFKKLLETSLEIHRAYISLNGTEGLQDACRITIWTEMRDGKERKMCWVFFWDSWQVCSLCLAGFPFKITSIVSIIAGNQGNWNQT